MECDLFRPALRVLRDLLGPEIERWEKALAKGDAEQTSAIVGEATGLIRDISPAAEILSDMTEQATTLLKTAEKFVS